MLGFVDVPVTSHKQVSVENVDSDEERFYFVLLLLMKHVHPLNAALTIALRHYLVRRLILILISHVVLQSHVKLGIQIVEYLIRLLLMSHPQVACVAVFWVGLWSTLRHCWRIVEEGRFLVNINLVNHGHFAYLFLVSLKHDLSEFAMLDFGTAFRIFHFADRKSAVSQCLKRLLEVIDRVFADKRCIVRREDIPQFVCHVESVKVEAIYEFAFLGLRYVAFSRLIQALKVLRKVNLFR